MATKANAPNAGSDGFTTRQRGTSGKAGPTPTPPRGSAGKPSVGGATEGKDVRRAPKSSNPR